MILKALAPCRISLFGGGSDINPYCDLYGGFCLNMAINIHQEITMYYDEPEPIYYIDPFAWNNYQTLPKGANPHFYTTFLKEYGIDDKIGTRLSAKFKGEITGGLGSSAAAAVAMMGLINERLELNLSLGEIALKAWEIEVFKLGLFGGKQDQFVAAFGGVNLMEFSKNKVEVTPLSKKFIKSLLPSLCLFYTGENRRSAKIQEGFKNLSSIQKEALDQIKALTFLAIEPVIRGDVEEVGLLLNEAWQLKQTSNKGVSTQRIDRLYEAALIHGAWGGKVLGAGGGGYALFICPLEKQTTLIESLAKLEVKKVDFEICWQGLEVDRL